MAEARPGEFELIARYFRPLATNPGAFDLTDDAAVVVTAPGEELVVTADLIAEGVHFFADDPPASIARKALRVNLSDLSAKGSRPAAYLMTLALSAGWTEAWVAAFTGALAEDQKRYAVSLLGGDTSRASGGTTISITAIGRLPAGETVLRSGARAGDRIVVSGTIGDAALGLRLRLGTLDPKPAGEGAAHLLDRYLHPEPRVDLAGAVRRFATAAIDVSDGLVGDLAHLCRASGVTAEVRAASVPLSAPARALVSADPSALATALTGGDDYEILATVPAALAQTYAEAAADIGIPVTEIGTILPGKGAPVVLDVAGRLLRFDRSSHTHF